jgi:hypothetical protein
MHKGIPNRATEPLAVVEVPLHVDDFRSGVQHYCFTDVEFVSPRSDALVTYLDLRWLDEGQEILVVSVLCRKRSNLLTETGRVNSDHIKPDEIEVGLLQTTQAF